MLKKANLTKVKPLLDSERKVVVLDAKDQILGRLAVKIVKLLQGKHKVIYAANINVGDYVVVINALQVKVTGNKEEQKDYTRYTGFPGGLRVDTYQELLKKNPGLLIRKAVSGMLPNNKLRKQYLNYLFIFKGEQEQLPSEVLAIMKK